MLRIMYIISARELKIAAIFIFFLSTYFCEFLKKQKTRLKDNFETSYNNPRYHSNYGNIKIPVTYRALTSPLPLRSITEGVYSLSLSVLRLRGDKSLESLTIASHQPATLSRLHNPTVLVTVVFCDIQILICIITPFFRFVNSF